jgi:hypothetical protein
MLQTILTRNLLKYSAGRDIFCKKCGHVADYRKWVMYESPAGQTGASCAACFAEQLQKVHAEDPIVELVSLGWNITTLAKLTTKPEPTYPQKTGRVLNTFIRKDIFAAFKRGGYCAKVDRKFPKGYTPIPLTETTSHDGTVTVDYAGNAEYSKLQIAEYVREFCKLNNLTMELTS